MTNARYKQQVSRDLGIHDKFTCVIRDFKPAATTTFHAANADATGTPTNDLRSA